MGAGPERLTREEKFLCTPFLLILRVNKYRVAPIVEAFGDMICADVELICSFLP